MHKYSLYIGIDTGVVTGFAMWDRKEKKLRAVKSMMIHEAMHLVLLNHNLHPGELLVRVEDARLRVESKYYGKAGPAKLQGVGSIKRDAKIWEDFLTDHHIPFEMVHPKNNKTKVRQDYFKTLTGWPDETNEHSRDAGMLVVGM